MLLAFASLRFFRKTPAQSRGVLLPLPLFWRRLGVLSWLYPTWVGAVQMRSEADARSISLVEKIFI
ncbi:hypothetical protein [Coleofasciculus sp. FACHB-129]|uniref:hypothetical protein n=1 Tax=Coleofasciculus sp. FACHB-129 TaxID=2692785 RepID=UPI001A7ED6EC|nr:hypothetical protein [Coleofasciculus sp. FACHB-129]